MARKKEYYFVPWGCGGQHGDQICPVTREEYKRESVLPPWQRRGAYFDSYIAACYYVDD